ncbi:hypothetical protein V6U71_06665 [Sphingopyxis sp. J-6]|uniref:hypothetical protein n=1 Tax=Sphingopyxis sp. J-6 TaxID=3122054 RepID=UPI00398441A5
MKPAEFKEKIRMSRFRWIFTLVVSPFIASFVVRPALAQQSYLFSNSDHQIEVGAKFEYVRIDGLASDVLNCSNEYEVCLSGVMALGIPKTGCSGTIDLIPASAKMQYASRDHHSGIQWMYHADNHDFVYEIDFDYNLRAIYHDFGLGHIRDFIALKNGQIDDIAVYRLPASAAVPPLTCVKAG